VRRRRAVIRGEFGEVLLRRGLAAGRELATAPIGVALEVWPRCWNKPRIQHQDVDVVGQGEDVVEAAVTDVVAQPSPPMITRAADQPFGKYRSSRARAVVSGQFLQQHRHPLPLRADVGFLALPATTRASARSPPMSFPFPSPGLARGPSNGRPPDASPGRIGVVLEQGVRPGRPRPSLFTV